jgi:hypothetical protein
MGVMFLRNFILFLCMIVPLFSLAEIKESDNTLVARREHNALKNLAKTFGTPDTILTQGVAIAYIDFNFVTCDILIVGPIKGDAKRYARILDEWQSRQNLQETVYYSQEDDCAAARLTLSNSKFGATKGSLNVNLPTLLPVLNQVEKTVHPVLRAGKGTDIDPGKPADFTSPNGHNYWLLKFTNGKLNDLNSTVVLPPDMPLILFIWFTLPLFGIIGGFGLAYIVAKKSTLAEARRSKLFSQIALGGTYGAIALHAILVMGTLFNGALNPISYLWFGTRFTAAAIFPVMLGPILALALLPVLNKLEKKAITKEKPTEQELAEKQKTEKVVEELKAKANEDQKAMRKKWLPFTIPMIVIGVALLNIRFLQQSNSVRFLSHFGILFIYAGIIAPTMAFLKQKRTPDSTNDSNIVTQVQYELSIIADQMGLPTPEVRIQSQKIFSATSIARKGKGIEVGDKFLHSITSPERNFFYAVELAKFKYRNIPTILFAVIGAFVLQTPMFYLLFILPSGSPEKVKVAPIAFGFMVFGMLGFSLILKAYRSSQIKKYDVLAARLVGKETAISALKQSVLPAPEFRIDRQFEEADIDNPIVGKRIKAIQDLPL